MERRSIHAVPYAASPITQTRTERYLVRTCRRLAAQLVIQRKASNRLRQLMTRHQLRPIRPHR